MPAAFPVLAEQDGIVLEADAAQAGAAAERLKATIAGALTDPVAEASIGRTWGD